MNKIALIVAASAAIFSSASFAQGYVGGALARTALDIDCNGTISCDESGTGIKLFGGYTFGNGFSVEGSYIRFGEQTVRIGAGAVDFNAHSFGVGAAYRYSFTPKWQATARLGLAHNKLEASAVSSYSESGIEPYFGFGGSYKVLPNLSIDAGLDFTRFEFADDKRGASLASVGVTFSF